MPSVAFEVKRYSSFETFIQAIRTWIHGNGVQCAQLCGCTTNHSYRSAWTSFKLQHFSDGRWNGPYVVNADTKREALLELLELVEAGKTAEEIFTPDKTSGDTRTVRVLGRSSAAGFYIYQHKKGVPLDAETRQCERSALRR
ncbi:hypothetical protein JYK02_11915 [Corallococcus macrosporus]|uniref:Uncharacterized protein n=1 Tax=Corallococcus macrosporus TaxID=35 RepID=A0ABS3D982_9BACT|nr:hypothetical protein [Corallococcus macrosporus]MBN8228215.1 hypothetical protein [Corallococcus macrosporus]